MKIQEKTILPLEKFFEDRIISDFSYYGDTVKILAFGIKDGCYYSALQTTDIDSKKSVFAVICPFVCVPVSNSFLAKDVTYKICIEGELSDHCNMPISVWEVLKANEKYNPFKKDDFSREWRKRVKKVVDKARKLGENNVDSATKLPELGEKQPVSTISWLDKILIGLNKRDMLLWTALILAILSW